MLRYLLASLKRLLKTKKDLVNKMNYILIQSILFNRLQSMRRRVSQMFQKKRINNLNFYLHVSIYGLLLDHRYLSSNKRIAQKLNISVEAR